MSSAPLIYSPPAERDEAIAQLLARAFQTDSSSAYMFPDAVLRAKRLPGMFSVLLKEDRARGIVLGTPGLEAVTLWRTPGHAHDSLIDFARSAPAFVRGLGRATLRGAEVAWSIARRLPKEPVWYLRFAACDPMHQGKGFGGAVIRAGLERADTERIGVYLETATEGNLALYRKLGFAVTSSWTIPGGPTFWGMLRAVQNG
jgi:GNAT superfamily N-acetyltransferase